MTQATPQPRRRWLRFGLRTTFLAIFAIGLLCAVYVMPIKRQEWAVASLELSGLQIAYDYQRQATAPGGYSFQATPPGWPLARKCLGKGFFQTAEKISIASIPLSVDELKPASELPNLVQVAIQTCGLTDEHLKCISGTQQLTMLFLPGNRITDDGLAQLAHLQNLQRLDLSDNEIEGPGLKSLAGLKQITMLWLNDNPLTDEALVHLAELNKLQILMLTNTNVAADGLKALARLKRLSYIELTGTTISAESVAELQETLPNCQIEKKKETIRRVRIRQKVANH